VRSSCGNTARIGKIRKATLKEPHNNQSIGSFEKFPSLNMQNVSHTRSCRLPLLIARKSPQKKLKHFKENYLLEKICLEKESKEHNSVVNIGIASTDDYKLRWRKRKEEFLTLLSRSVQQKQA
jgi:hypothetical protein